MTNLDAMRSSAPDPLRRRATIAVVFAGGDPVDADEHRRLRLAIHHAEPERLVVIAADSGLHAAQADGWPVDIVVGDLDSVAPGRLVQAEAAGARLDRHPPAKDATDLELALDSALDAGADQIVVAGGHGGRLDHFLANLLLLGADRLASASVSAILGPAWMHVVREQVRWTAARGDLVTLLPLHGRVTGVTTTGLLYPLDGATLLPGSTRGVSNEHVGGEASVSVASGVLAVVVPGAAGVHVDAGDRAGSATPSAPGDRSEPAELPELPELPEPPATPEPGGPRVP